MTGKHQPSALTVALMLAIARGRALQEQDYGALPVGMASLRWLEEFGLIDTQGHATERGRVWVRAICQTPLPIATWSIPAAGWPLDLTTEQVAE